ncbi:NVEALA domain-containing protein [Bacteroides sp. 224]|uniref:NVEALA domain-containing protein n=1 Tax=Bacteroides sp. 224 TaxID=2302936 RepID=UPI0013D08074|nr:NVEALA domain-containing protein [Bacteroides sp. 224]NDV66549.1 hypothetical protein [Bacteroides sp. 224]
MKKNVLKVVFSMMLFFFIGYNVYVSQKGSLLSDLLLNNVEALADDKESDGTLGCWATICDKSCRFGDIIYSYTSEEECPCSLCTGDCD